MRVLFGFMTVLSLLSNYSAYAATPEAPAPEHVAEAPAATPAQSTPVEMPAPVAPAEESQAAPIVEPVAPAVTPTDASAQPTAEATPVAALVEESPVTPTVEPEATAATSAQPSAETPAQPTEPAEEIKGIDTLHVDEPQGNWLFKRIWWEKAEDKYERIKSLVDEILDKRMEFFEKQVQIDKTVFDPFYLEVGMEQGQLKEVMEYYTKRLEDLRAKGDGLNIDERGLLDTLENERTRLEALAKDIDIIGQYDQEINKVLLTVMEQMGHIRKFEREAWDNFKAISQALSDKKAKDLYYQMDTAWKNVLQVQDYINGPLNQHFDDMAHRVKEYTERIKQVLAELKEKGVDIKKKSQEIEDEHQGIVQPQPVEEEDEDEEPAPARGWFSFIGDAWGALKELVGGSSSPEHSSAASATESRGWFSWIGDLWSGLKSWLTAGSSAPTSQEHAPVAEPVHTEQPTHQNPATEEHQMPAEHVQEPTQPEVSEDAQEAHPA